MTPEPYIPLRVTDLIEVLLTEAGTPEHPQLAADHHDQFRTLAAGICRRIESNYSGLFNTLKEAYAPFDPDIETLRLGDSGDSDYREKIERLLTSFTVLLERGGFHRMSREEIENTMQGTSYWGIEMDVCWDVFDRVEVFYRGKGSGWRTRRPWWRLFRTQEVEVPTFRRVVMVLKQQRHARLGPHADTTHVFMKIFKDIPTMDVEMLLPGTRLRMPKFERGKLGGTVIGSFGYVLFKLVTSVNLAALLSGSLFALATPLFLILGYGYKTVVSFRVSKRSYLLQLAQSLYYQNLDTNAGVLHRLFDEAAEQDIRQTLLAYYFLWRFAGTAGWSPAELDRAVETDLERRLGLKIEVDTDEALSRLQRLRLATRVGDRFVAVPIEQAQIAVTNPLPVDEAPESKWQATMGLRK